MDYGLAIMVSRLVFTIPAEFTSQILLTPGLPDRSPEDGPESAFRFPMTENFPSSVMHDEIS
jgi:hypothetical protein